ncbi:hypothetical protein ONZ45_g6697 [Pleurotus djamor]|nr:hypothetical protein ONZ45_g6697 [Pleurotus djamor]
MEFGERTLLNYEDDVRYPFWVPYSNDSSTHPAPITGIPSTKRDTEATPFGGDWDVDAVMEDDSQMDMMEVDDRVECYRSADVFDGDEAIHTLKAVLGVFGSTIKELSFPKVVVEHTMNRIFSEEKRGIVYGFNKEDKPIFVVNIPPDRIGSIMHTSNPFTPIFKVFGDYSNLVPFAIVHILSFQ